MLGNPMGQTSILIQRRVAIPLAPSCYRNRDKFSCQFVRVQVQHNFILCVWLQIQYFGFTLVAGGAWCLGKSAGREWHQIQAHHRKQTIPSKPLDLFHSA